MANEYAANTNEYKEFAIYTVHQLNEIFIENISFWFKI